MPLDLTDDKSTLAQVMAWCRQATSHYLSQCWLSSFSPYGIARPQWVNVMILADLLLPVISMWDLSMTFSAFEFPLPPPPIFFPPPEATKEDYSILTLTFSSGEATMVTGDGWSLELQTSGSSSFNFEEASISIAGNDYCDLVFGSSLSSRFYNLQENPAFGFFITFNAEITDVLEDSYFISSGGMDFSYKFGAFQFAFKTSTEICYASTAATSVGIWATYLISWRQNGPIVVEINSVRVVETAECFSRNIAEVPAVNKMRFGASFESAESSSAVMMSIFNITMVTASEDIYVPGTVHISQWFFPWHVYTFLITGPLCGESLFISGFTWQRFSDVDSL